MESFDLILRKKIALLDDVLTHPIGKKSMLFKIETQREFNLNETATRMLNILLESTSIEAAYNQLLQEYKIAPEFLQKDLLALIEKLVYCQLIAINNPVSEEEV